MAFDGFTIAALVSEMDAKLTAGAPVPSRAFWLRTPATYKKLHSRRQTNFCFP